MMQVHDINNQISQYAHTAFRPSFRWMHWFMAILFLLAIASIELKEHINTSDSLNRDLLWIHVQCGTSIFALVWLRIAMRVGYAYPPVFPSMNRFHHAVTFLAHMALYVFTICIPLLGIIALQTRGVNIDFLGVNLPIIISESQGLKYSLALISYHDQYGTYLIYFIIGHVFFALLHHYYWKDNVLIRMIPGKWATNAR